MDGSRPWGGQDAAPKQFSGAGQQLKVETDPAQPG